MNAPGATIFATDGSLVLQVPPGGYASMKAVSLRQMRVLPERTGVAGKASTLTVVEVKQPLGNV